MVQWTLTDHLRTVRDIVQYDPDDDMTTVVNHLIYDSFGRVTSESNPAVDSLFLFTGRPFDSDTRLQNNLNRWYDPAVGRWLSEDPIGFAAGDGNLYRYVGNDPSEKLDWDGLAAWSGTTRYILKAWRPQFHVGKWGQFSVSVNWIIDPKPISPPKPTGLSEKSLIIQHIVATFDVRLPSGERIRHPADDGRWDYWEAWVVEAGKASPFLGLRDDTFGMPPAEPDTCGTVVMTGVAQFYPNQELPPQFQFEVNPHAGHLWATTDATAVSGLVAMSFAPLTRVAIATWRPDFRHGQTQLSYTTSYAPLPELGFPGQIA